MDGPLAAVKFLTIAGRFFNRDEHHPQQIAGGAPYFPLVGLLLGAILALLNRALEPYLESEILGVVLILLLIIMTGAIHLKQTQQFFDNAPQQTGRTDHVGVSALVALLFTLLLKIRAVEVIGETRGLSLLLTPVYARWALVIFLYGSARGDAAARTIAQHVRPWHLLVTTAATLLLAFYLAGRTGLWIALWVSLFALITRHFAQQRRQGIVNPTGVVIEIGETLSLVLFATL